MSSGSTQLKEREALVLRHIARYRLTFQEVLSALYFEGKSPQKVLSGLLTRELLGTFQTEGFQRKRRGYVLTENATALLGVPRSRANELKGQAVPEQLARFSYCYLSGRSCCYVEPKEAPFDWGEAFGKNRYLSLVVRECFGGHALDLVTLVGERTRKSSCKDRLATLQERVKETDELRAFAESGHLQIVLIGQTPARRDHIAAWLEDQEWSEVVAGPCPVAAVHVPWLDELEEALRRVVA